MSEKLEEIRKKIDALDDQIHDLLMERADLIVDVTEEKRKGNIEVVQPAREARMIRRLLARHRGPLPEAAIVKIWRELVGAVSLLQKGLKVSVAVPEGQGFCWDMAKEYFGTVLPMIKSSASVASISAVREDEVSFAVVPWPLDSDANPWWQHLMHQEKDKMRVIAAMPYGLAQSQLSGIQDRALVVAKSNYSPSGEDHSFIALQIARDVSRARIIDVFRDIDLKVLGISTRGNNSDLPVSLHLVEIDDYLAEDDPRIHQFEKKFTGMEVQAVVIGGYPVPPVYKSVERKTDV